MADIDSALEQAVGNFVGKRPRTLALQERAARVMPGGNTRTVLHTAPFPIRASTAEGAHITDVDGHTYLDVLGEYSAGIFGHSHPVIREAVAEAMAMGVNMGAPHDREIALAEIVTGRYDLDLVRFTNSGTEANMMALAAARCFTKRSKIMPMFGGYHGGTLFFSAGPSPVNAPYDCVLGKYNGIDETRRIVGERGGEIAAIIVEPMLGGGGCIAAEPAFLAMLKEEAGKAGIVLIFDEVMTSRLHPGGLSAKWGIQPDLKTLGKYVGGGMSFGAFGGRREIMQMFDPTRADSLPHAGTYNNNTLTMTAGTAAMTRVFTPAACDALNARGDALRNRLNDLFMRYQVRLRATGMGSMLTLHPAAGEVTAPEQVNGADKRLRRLLFLDLLDQGIYMAERGLMALSLMVTDEDCDRIVAAMETVIKTRRDLLV